MTRSSFGFCSLKNCLTNCFNLKGLHDVRFFWLNVLWFIYFCTRIDKNWFLVQIWKGSIFKGECQQNFGYKKVISIKQNSACANKKCTMWMIRNRRFRLNLYFFVFNFQKFWNGSSITQKYWSKPSNFETTMSRSNLVVKTSCLILSQLCIIVDQWFSTFFSSWYNKVKKIGGRTQKTHLYTFFAKISLFFY